MNPEPFFRYLKERETILLNRYEDKPWPWTDDPILQKYRFCNVFREDDRTTRWLKNHIREPERHDPRVAFNVIAFRWFNRITTGEILYRSGLFEHWDTITAEDILRDSGPPWTTGSYIIKTPNGMDKLGGVLWCIDKIPRNIGSVIQILPENQKTLHYVWDMLRQYPYMGDFMAYEVVTDLRHTDLLHNAPDKYTWANPGPGACRGAARILGKPLDSFNRQSPADRAVVIDLMQQLIQVAEQYLPRTMVMEFELREIEHGLCEFDKYERARLGEGRPRQIYRHEEKSDVFPVS